jgi:urease accessory protein UreF
MSAEKLSISLDSDLVAAVRAAASEQGVSVSTWLAGAAESRVQQRRLGEALAALAADIGDLDAQEVDELIIQAHRNSKVITAVKGVA